MSGIKALQKSLSCAAQDANQFFFAKARSAGREEYFSRGNLGDAGTGAVYAYFDAADKALYVGEASRPIKRRMHDQTSPHKKAEWWSKWVTVRFIQMENRTDRLALELLLILGL